MFSSLDFQAIVQQIAYRAHEGGSKGRHWPDMLLLKEILEPSITRAIILLCCRMLELYT